MPNVSGNVNLTASFTETISSGVVTTQSLPASITQGLSYSSGTGPGQCDLLYSKQLSLAGSATTLDLTSLADLAGSSYSFARVRELIITNLASTGGYTLTIGSASASAWTGFLGTASATAVIHPGTSAGGNTHRWSDYYNTGSTSGAVTGASSKLLKLDPGANTFSVNIIILGCSAFS